MHCTSVAFNYTLIASLGECNLKTCVQILAKPLLLETALIAYDSLLTFSEEVIYIWKKKWKLGTVLYLLARYAMLLYMIQSIIMAFFNFTSLQVCFFHGFY